MSARQIALGALGSALALTMVPTPADALVIARVTRHGYIMVDEEGAAATYGARVPDETSLRFQFISDVTSAIAAYPDAPHATYLAILQTQFSQGSATAYYQAIKNDTTGIGQRSPLGDGRETFDLNPRIPTAFSLQGFVWLNTIGFLVNPGLMAYGRNVICPQEFAHRFGAVVRIPPYPAMPMGGGGPDASVDVAVLDAGAPDDVMPEDVSVEDASDDATDDDVTLVTDTGPMDAGAPDAGMDPPLAADGLLGRQRAHWSYFVNSGGSALEGNNWEEIRPGVFRTGPRTFRFSPLDLYVMGLLPPSAVPPFYVIAEPNTMGQRDENGGLITRESGPESRRMVTIRGRRVTYSIQDIIRTNGARTPAYIADAGDSGRGAPADMEVAWVLLASPGEVTQQFADLFDQAVETCSAGYAEAAGDRSHLIARSAPPTDSGVVADAAVDGESMPDALVTDASVRDATTRDGGVDDSGLQREVDAYGGCAACSATPGGSGSRGAARGVSLAAVTGLALVSRKRRRGRAALLTSRP